MSCNKRGVRRLVVGWVLLAGFASCHRPAREGEPAPETAKSTVASAAGVETFGNVFDFGANDGFKAFVAANQATLAQEKSRLVIHATGTDPQIALPKLNVASGSRVAFRFDLESPSATRLELYYQTRQSAQFSADRVARADLHAGRNLVLLEINDPQFNGALRFDPGEAAGDYIVNSFEAFAQGAIGVALRQSSQPELAATFESSATVLFEAKNVETLSKVKAANQATLTPGPTGLFVKATGDDPELLLPEFSVGRHCVAKIAVTAPRETTLQLFYLTPGQANYDDAHVANVSLKAGKTVAYCEIAAPGIVGAWRLDPGMLAGDYVIESIEVRAVAVP